MTERTFTLPDQRRFAALSGDRNPLHLDVAVARRSILGGVAVHGVHALLWALDQLAAETSVSGFAKLRVNFDRGVLIDAKVQCTWEREGERWVGRIKGAAGTLVRMSVVPTQIPSSPWRGQTEPGCVACEEHTISELENLSGTLDLSLPDTWREMFPQLAAASPPVMVAALLATTRLVGMKCPGLYSIYSALQLHYVSPADAPETDESRLHYKVSRTDSRVRIVDLAIRAGPFRGELNTLVRPKPFAQPRLAEILPLVSPGASTNQNALIIGGSRGLGELATKLLVASGARVTLTWRQGEADALAIAAEARGLGRNIQTLKFDVAAPPQAAPAPDQRFTHLYYFATPSIQHGRPGQFNSVIFEEFLEYYVSGFARTIDWFHPRAVAAARVWYPSTVFLNEPNPDFAEYSAAKARGEALCQQLAGQLAPMRFFAPRLPRLPTDQTQTLAATFMADGVTTLLGAFSAAELLPEAGT